MTKYQSYRRLLTVFLGYFLKQSCLIKFINLLYFYRYCQIASQSVCTISHFLQQRMRETIMPHFPKNIQIFLQQKYIRPKRGIILKLNLLHLHNCEERRNLVGGGKFLKDKIESLLNDIFRSIGLYKISTLYLTFDTAQICSIWHAIAIAQFFPQKKY